MNTSICQAKLTQSKLIKSTGVESSLTNILLFLIVFSLSLLSGVTFSKPGLSAETIKLVYGPFKCSLSVDALETYANTGEITQEFSLYTKFLDEKTLVQLRDWLQKRFDSNHVKLSRFTNTPKGEKLLKELGTVVQTHSERNGFYALRAALVQAAAKPEGWTILDAIKQFPTENMQINTKDLFKLKDFWQESSETL
jgi:hypothetical protein